MWIMDHDEARDQTTSGPEEAHHPMWNKLSSPGKFCTKGEKRDADGKNGPRKAPVYFSKTHSIAFTALLHADVSTPTPFLAGPTAHMEGYLTRVVFLQLRAPNSAQPPVFSQNRPCVLHGECLSSR